MPFTLSHPSILFPFRWINKKYISLTGLVAGSVAPDFEYFLVMRPAANMSHTLRGIWLMDLPLSILFAFLFHFVIKQPLITHFPFFKNKYIQPRFDFIDYLKKNWLTFLICSLIGIISHLLWDAFTHAQGYFVLRSNYLSEEIMIGNLEIRRCYVIWYASSIIGLIVVMLYSMDLKKIFNRNRRSFNTYSSRYWTLIIALTIAFTVLRVMMGVSWNWFRHFIIILIGSFTYALIIISWFENIRLRKVTS